MSSDECLPLNLVNCIQWLIFLFFLFLTTGYKFASYPLWNPVGCLPVNIPSSVKVLSSFNFGVLIFCIDLRFFEVKTLYSSLTLLTEIFCYPSHLVL